MKRDLLFLDDIRNPIDCASYMTEKGVDVSVYKKEWDIVRSYDEFVSYINFYGLPKVISFDHDLGDIGDHQEKTGMDCAKFLTNYCIDNDLKLPQTIVHSANTVGEENINALFKSFRRIFK